MRASAALALARASRTINCRARNGENRVDITSHSKPSQVRMKRAVRHLRSLLADGEEGSSFRRLDPEPQLLYVVGTLICDDLGRMRSEDLAAAMQNAYYCSAGMYVLDKVGLLPTVPDPLGLSAYRELTGRTRASSNPSTDRRTR